MDKTIHSEDYRVLCTLLRGLRQAAGLRQVELAAVLDEPQSFVSKFETGERRLDLIEVRTICQALGTDLPSFVAALEERLRAGRDV